MIKIDYFMSENFNTQFHSCLVTVGCFGFALLLLFILFQEKLDSNIYRISLTPCRQPNIDIVRSQQAYTVERLEILVSVR
jgi:hypothetical protein